MSQLAASPSRRPAQPASLRSSRQLGLRWLERSACVLLFFAIWEFLPRAGLVNSAFLSPPSAVLAAISNWRSLASWANTWLPACSARWQG